MTVWICATCAVEHRDSAAPPNGECAICADERQYVPEDGQRWTTLTELREAGTTIDLAEVEPGLYGLSTTPAVGIGQRALLLQTDDGNLLWDPVGYVDDAAIEKVRELGGIAFVVASHPHMYGVQVEWSHAFGNAPVLVPEADKRWLMRPDPVVRFWEGTVKLLPGTTLIQVGGHFPGSAAVHWTGAADDNGVLLAGDTVMPGRRVGSASFMRSFPNMIPLSQAAVRKIVANLEPYEYDRLYSNFGTVVRPNAKAGVKASAERYLAWIRGDFDDDI
ncbi:MBL fold metallo-hydrolase [Tenggerimyces flavus]|uniref:MBL fold metallo-hydrolase n=1 Tax=Tenggerimyces flavus TaxID=1708749 RepID=A0ABV7Y5F9_9ACTN|nr:MBL fold metallo-hydrolase [Tenggerimyces flavus]MBM7788444.1 glyoxylase-like metal-dependent hydrolase (beta-lactamase superfamily II) [Tenggerimyces flavus]